MAKASVAKASDLAQLGCLTLMLPVLAGGAPAWAGETGGAGDVSVYGTPIELTAGQLDGVSAGGVSLGIGAGASAVGRLFPAVSIANSQSSVAALKTALSQTDVAAGAAVAVAVGDVSHGAQTGAAVAVDNPMIAQAQTIPVTAGPVSISVTTVTAIGMDVMGVFRAR